MADKRLEQMAAAKRAEEDYEINVSGSFNCQQCGECMDGAYLDGVKGVLLWKCTSGHTSFITDIGL